MPDDEITQRLIHLQDQIDELSLRLGKDNFSNTIIENKTIIQQTAKYRSKDFVSGSTGWEIRADGEVEFNSGVFRGTVAVNSLDIPDATTANSFHVDSLGNAWWGATTLGASTAKVLNTGIATFNTIFIEGGTFVATDVLLSEQRFNTLFERYCFVGRWKDTLIETPGAGGSISRYPILTRLSSAGADCTLNSTRMHVDSGNTDFVTANANVEFIGFVKLGATVTQDAIWGITDDGNKTLPVNTALTSIHMAFIVEDDKLYASTGNGAAQILGAEITGITLTDLNAYRIAYDKSTDTASFYVNDSLVDTLASSGSAIFDPAILFGIDAIAGTKTMELTNNYLMIHS